VHILEGGLPGWLAEGLPVAQAPQLADDKVMAPTAAAQQPPAQTGYQARLQADKVRCCRVAGAPKLWARAAGGELGIEPAALLRWPTGAQQWLLAAAAYP
jgi:hypothetical protein